MKKIFAIVGLLFVLYLILLGGYRFYGKGHHYQYELNTDSNHIFIDETFVNDKNYPNYYLRTKINDDEFFYQTFYDFKNQSKIIKDVYYYSDKKYKCILPVFTGDKLISDILCKTNNDYLYYYNSLRGMNENLDNFVSSLSDKGYNYQKWIDTSDAKDNDGIKVYSDNLISDYFLALTNYKGLVILNTKSKQVKNINLFNTDVYQNKLDFMYKNKYIVADYNDKFRFHNFIVVDITNGEKTNIISGNEISFDSYFQGLVDNKLYLFDKDSKKQYAIDLIKNNIKEVGNENNGIKIYNFNTKEWQTTSAITASNEIVKFIEYEAPKQEDYEKVELYGSDQFGYKFYYKKVDDKYLVYRSSINDNTQLTYIFTTTNIDNIIYTYDLIYFINDDYIMSYSDNLGVKRILSYEELKFNDSLHFNVFSK